MSDSGNHGGGSLTPIVDRGVVSLNACRAIGVVVLGNLNSDLRWVLNPDGVTEHHPGCVLTSNTLVP